MPRELLRETIPDSGRRLSEPATARVLAWYALRYGRAFWPDEFVGRISHIKDDLEAELEPLKNDIAEVRVSIAEQDEELNEGESYHVAVFFVVDEKVWDEDVEGRDAIHMAFAKFVSDLESCDGIEVDKANSDVVSGGVLTWQETRATDEWNFANLSYRE